MKPEFIEGDVVFHKSNPKFYMVIRAVKGDDRYVCQWFRKGTETSQMYKEEEIFDGCCLQVTTI